MSITNISDSSIRALITQLVVRYGVTPQLKSLQSAQGYRLLSIRGPVTKRGALERNH